MPRIVQEVFLNKCTTILIIITFNSTDKSLCIELKIQINEKAERWEVNDNDTQMIRNVFPTSTGILKITHVLSIENFNLEELK